MQRNLVSNLLSAFQVLRHFKHGAILQTAFTQMTIWLTINFLYNSCSLVIVGFTISSLLFYLSYWRWYLVNNVQLYT